MGTTVKQLPLNEVGEHFRVCLRIEDESFGAQFGTKRLIVLDGAVVYDGDTNAIGEVRMRILL
jgi:hypothetical protein